MHPHSCAAFAAGQADGSTGKRAQACLSAVRELGTATDRDVLTLLFGLTMDMNAVRPRLTELVQAGWLAECGEVRDIVTDKLVRVLRATTPEERAARAAAFAASGAEQLAMEWTGGGA